MTQQNKNTVYFFPFHQGQTLDKRLQGVSLLLQKTGIENVVSKQDIVAIKIHFGEQKNTTHIPAAYVRPVSDCIKKLNGKPFVTDTCVLYKSQRDNSVDHLVLAHEHGFTLETTGAPVIIADGLVGNLERDVTIDCPIYKTVSIAASAIEANAIIVMSHVTGHIATGLGAAIKNIGMGFASRKGKLKQHSAMKPSVKRKKCTGCGVCVQWCPAQCISLNDGKAEIDSSACIGCGECLAVCRFGAVKHDWAVSENDLQQRMAEHALGVVKGRTHKMLYLNFLINLTKDCDCFDIEQEPVLPDIGIVAGFDPVSVDAASLDLIAETHGTGLEEVAYPAINAREQIEYGEKIGLGTTDYTVVRITE